jgi:carbamoyl-phosphate synthase large subunit
LKPKLLHVLGGGHWQVPTVRSAKALGHRVLVTDAFENRPAFALADWHERADLADHDATLRVAKRYDIDGVLCDTTDVGVATAAYVAESLGLPGIGFETALNFSDKARMRSRTAAAGCSAPRFHLLRSEADLTAAAALGFPLTVKPLDNQSGRGVTRVTRAQDLRAAYLAARAKSRLVTEVLAEEWVEGVEYIVDGLVLSGEPALLGISRKTPNALNPTVSDHITYQPLQSEPVHQLLADANRRALAALGLRMGMFHGEYKVRGNEIFPIDLAARGGGVMIYTHVLPAISGIDANRCMIELALGLTPRVQRTLNRAANIEFLRLPFGTVQAIDDIDQALAMPGVLGLHLHIQPGSKVSPAIEKDDRPGYLLAVADSVAEAMQRTAAALARLRITMNADS